MTLARVLKVWGPETKVRKLGVRQVLIARKCKHIQCTRQDVRCFPKARGQRTWAAGALMEARQEYRLRHPSGAVAIWWGG
jgi:hypothetical protein